MFKRIAVGEKYEEFRRGEGIKFNMVDSGSTLTILLNRPTIKEVDNIKNGRLQFGLFIKDGIIFFLSKFGDMEWMDAPFHVALSPDLTTLQELNEDMGYSCSIILADSLNGEVKVLRFISFSTLFSIKLKEAIEDQFVDFFDKDKYSLKLRNIMSAYTSENMVTMSLVNCKIK